MVKVRKYKISTRTEQQHLLKDDNTCTFLRLAKLCLDSRMLFLFLTLALHRMAVRWSYLAIKLGHRKTNVNVAVYNIQTQLE